jgi:CBS domain-containing protein
MKLVSLLEENLIVISRDVSPIGESLEEMLDLVISGYQVQSSKDALLKKLTPQVKRGGFKVGEKVSMFHLTIPEIEDSRLAVKSMGGKDGTLLFFLSTPRTSPKFYLQVAAALRTVAADDGLIQGIRSAENARLFFDLLDSSDVVLNPRIEVKNIMKKDLLSIESEATLDAVVEQMIFKGSGGLVVTDSSKKVLGAITESDLVRVFLPELMATLGESDQRDIEASPHGDIGERYKVKDFMSRSVMCVSEDTTITEVATLMVNKKVRKIPVVREGKLVGIASLQDIIQGVLRGWFV